MTPYIQRVTAYIQQFNKGLWILSLGWFVSALGFSISIPFISIYFYSTLHLSLSEIGVFFGAMAVVRSVFQVVGGEISDRIQRRSLLIYCQVIRAGMFFFLALSIYNDWGFAAVAGFMLLNSVFGAVFQPAANAMVSDILPAGQHLDGYAVARSAGNLGWAAGPALGGFLAGQSYGLLFMISSLVTLVSGLIFWLFMARPKLSPQTERFRLSDFAALRHDRNMAAHCFLIFVLYLVVAQLIATFSVYTVDMLGISQNRLGLLYTLNGLLVVSTQIPVTKFLSGMRLTLQISLGACCYALGYGIVGLSSSMAMLAGAMVIITTGEICMSPPSLALTSRLAPQGRIGRYMGVFGLSVSSGWSLGPVYGGLILDNFGHHHALAWAIISSPALVSALGYLWLTKKLPDSYNKGTEGISPAELK